ncbi:transcriptional repressor LexA [bacterium]|nr:transcriptional repressor LexA [bacterium]
MMKSLTDRQKQILEFVIGSINDRGYPPSVRDICRHFDIQSPQGAQRHLNALEKKGYLKRDARLARSLSVTTLSESMLGSHPKPEWVPVLGDVAAGAPILAQEDVIDQIPLSKDWLGMGKEHFFLRIKGDSMAEAIQPGDLVLVERGQTASRGEIVVALLEDEATCKRFFPDKTRVYLRSDNPRYDDIVVSNDFKLLGKVKALVRKY